MPSTLSRLFQLSWKLSPELVLYHTHAKLQHNTSVTVKNLNELEQSLNNFFYGQHKKESKENAIQQEVIHAQQTFIDNALTGALSTLKKIDPEADVKFYGSKKHDDRTKMKLDVFLKRKDQLMSMLTTLKQNNLDITNIYQQALELYKLMSNEFKNLQQETSNLSINLQEPELQEAIENASSQFRNHMILINKTAQQNAGKDIFNTLDKVYNLLYSWGNFNQVIGEMFERSMYVYMLIRQKGIQNVSQNTVQKMLNNYLSGNNKTAPLAAKHFLQGSVYVSRVDYIPLDKSDQFLDQHTNKPFTYSATFSSTPDDIHHVPYTIDVAASYKDAYGKIDIHFLDGSQSYNMSLKNWSGIDNLHNFGVTSLLNAMVRTGGIDRTMSYAAVIGYYGPKDRLGGEYAENTTNLHRYAKACVLVDTLIGYSQKNIADTLVVNLSKQVGKGQIRVFSMREIIDAIWRNLDLLDKYVGEESGNSINTKVDLTDLLSRQTIKKITIKKQRKKVQYTRNQPVSTFDLNQLITRLESIKLGVSAGILKDPAIGRF